MLTFKEWLIKYKDKDTIRGDLAKDIIRDRNFPDTVDKEKVFSYMEYQLRLHDNKQVFSTFKRMYADYLKTHQNQHN